MRFKYYLRGCGLGILFASIVLSIAFYTGGAKEISDEEVIRRAEALGMVMEGAPGESDQPGTPGGSQPKDKEQPEASQPGDDDHTGDSPDSPPDKNNQ